MAKQLVFLAPKQVGYQQKVVAEPAAGEIRIRTLLSGISHGTEMVAWHGNSPFINQKIIEGRFFVPKEADDADFYPFCYAGYDLVGEVVSIGEGVTDFQPGDHIFAQIPHQTEALLRADDPEIFLLQPTTLPEDAIMASLAAVAYNAIHDAEIKLGDTVAIFGAGMVGQLAAQLAFLNGAGRVMLVEPRAERRTQAAHIMPVLELIDPSVELAAKSIYQANDKNYPDVVIECSGSIAGLSAAIQTCGIAGTVIAAGFYAGPASDLYLGAEFLTNRVTIKASMGVWGCPSRSPLTWDHPRTMRSVLQLIEAKKLRFDDYVSLRIPFSEAQRAYEIIEREPNHLKVVLTY